MATRKKTKKRTQRQQYRATRLIQWGDTPFTLKEGQEFTEADLLPGMEAALRKWVGVGAAVKITEEKQITQKEAEQIFKDKVLTQLTTNGPFEKVGAATTEKPAIQPESLV